MEKVQEDDDFSAITDRSDSGEELSDSQTDIDESNENILNNGCNNRLVLSKQRWIFTNFELCGFKVIWIAY